MLAYMCAYPPTNMCPFTYKHRDVHIPHTYTYVKNKRDRNGDRQTDTKRGERERSSVFRTS